MRWTSEQDNEWAAELMEDFELIVPALERAVAVDNRLERIEETLRELQERQRRKRNARR